MPVLFGGRASRSLRLLSSATIPVHPLNQTYCRPDDIRRATNALAIKTCGDTAKAQRSTKPQPAKSRKQEEETGEPESRPESKSVLFHCYGNWTGWNPNLSRLGNCPQPPHIRDPRWPSIEVGWVPFVLYWGWHGGGDDETGSIKFNLLAIVKDQFCEASDQLELLRRVGRPSRNTQMKFILGDGMIKSVTSPCSRHEECC